MNSVPELEIYLKKTLTEAHKKQLGVGPSKVFVRVTEKVILVILSGCLTPLEANMITDISMVRHIRDGFFKEWVTSIESFLGLTVLDTRLRVYPEQNMMCVFLFYDGAGKVFELSQAAQN